LDPHDLAVAHRLGCRQPQRLADQASFAEEFARSEDRDDRFLALLGRDGDLDLAFLDVIDGVCRSGLSIDDDVLGVVGDRAAPAHGREKRLGIEAEFNRFCHELLLIEN